MTDQELVENMEATSVIGDFVRLKIKELIELIDYMTELILKISIKEKIAMPPGVRDTNINDAIKEYDTNLSVLINIIKNYILNFKKSTEKIGQNYSVVNQVSKSIDKFIDFNCQLTLIRDDIRDFIQKANKFDDEFDEFIQTNRVINIENILLEIKKNHEILSSFIKDKAIVLGVRTIAILQKIEQKIHGFAQRNKSF